MATSDEHAACFRFASSIEKALFRWIFQFGLFGNEDMAIYSTRVLVSQSVMGQLAPL